MKKLPDSVISDWENREPIAVLATVGTDNSPNAIYASNVARHDDSTFIIANNAFHKTRQNILSGTKASLLFITKNFKAYQIKGSITLQENGPLFEVAKRLTPEKYVCHSAAVLQVEEVFSGAERLL